MAPQVTVYFHKLPANDAKKTGCRTSFVIGHALATRTATKSKHGAKKNNQVVKAIKPQIGKMPSKNALRNQRKRLARAQRKRDAQTKTVEAILAELAQLSQVEPAKIPPTKVCTSSYVMVGSIPVYLPITASVMVTSTEEEEEQASPRSTTSTHLTNADARSISEGVVRALETSSKRGRPKGSKNRQYPVFGSDSYQGPVTRNIAKKSHGDAASVGTASEDEASWSDINPLYEGASVVEKVSGYKAKVGSKSPLFIKGTPHGSVSRESENEQVLVANQQMLEEQLEMLQRKLAQLEFEATQRQEEEAKRRAELEAEAARKLAEKEAEVSILLSQLVANKGKNKDDFLEQKDHGPGPSGSSMTPDDVKTMIAEAVKQFQVSLNPPVIGYRKPYPPHYDAIPFPKGYQRPSFDKFDGINGSPHEHLAHFHFACGETSQLDAFLVRQFVQSLKGSAFTWYSQLEPGSITTWDDMQRAFLAQFVSSKKKVSIIDLADARQKVGENANEFITRWRSLNLQCPEKLTKQSAVQMCANNSLPDIATYIGTAEPTTFDALVSKASNVERQIARTKALAPKVQTTEKRAEAKKPTVNKGESMATFIKAEKKNEGSNSNNNMERGERPRRISIQERRAVKYSFDDDDLDSIFSELLKAKAIKLPEPKRPAEVNKTNDPKYCKYHRLLGHTLKDCFVLKDIIQKMINNNEIEIDSSASANMIEEGLPAVVPTIPTVSLPEDAVKADNEVTIVHAYSDMPGYENLNIPSLYELMTAPSFDSWEDSEDSDGSPDGWKTVTKKVQHPPLHKKSSARTGMKFRGYVGSLSNYSGLIPSQGM